MDEFAVVMKAREFIALCGPSALPVAVDTYAQQVGGSIIYEPLHANEDAWSVRLPNGKLKICVNSAQLPRRQRFSVCHEVAHAVLSIEADHTAPGWSYSRRPPGEIACDAFAAELLLPHKLFKPRVDAADVGFAAISQLSKEFDASLMSTGSRFATFSGAPCAFLISEGGKVRYCARSASLREARAWVAPGSSLPSGSLSAKIRAGGAQAGPDDADPDDWFTSWDRDGSLREDVRHFEQWDQTLTLLWFDDEDLPSPPADAKKWDPDLNGLRELDGNLPWPGRKKRR